MFENDEVKAKKNMYLDSPFFICILSIRKCIKKCLELINSRTIVSILKKRYMIRL